MKKRNRRIFIYWIGVVQIFSSIIVPLFQYSYGLNRFRSDSEKKRNANIKHFWFFLFPICFHLWVCLNEIQNVLNVFKYEIKIMSENLQTLTHFIYYPSWIDNIWLHHLTLIHIHNEQHSLFELSKHNFWNEFW